MTVPVTLPAPSAVDFAEAFRFWPMHRASGGIVAGALFALPSLFILIALSRIYLRFGAQRWPEVFALGRGHGAGKSGHGPALIGDLTPAPAHARFTRARLLRVLGIGVGSWRVGMRCCWPCRAGRARSRRWGGSSPRRRCWPSVAPAPYCPLSTRARWSSTLDARHLADGIDGWRKAGQATGSI